MRWLLITDENAYSSSLEQVLLESDKKNKLSICSFETESLSSQKKNFLSFAGCIIASKNPDKIDSGNLLFLTGFFTANSIPIFTNISFLNDFSTFSGKLIKVFDSFDDITKHIQKKYSTIETDCKKRLAKNKLLDRGIPFTGDCFGTYIAKNKIEIVNEFLEAGMSVNSRDDMGVPMLNIACRNDNFEFVEMLLNLGAELNASSEDRGYTAVMDAVWRGNEKITKMLIDKGAELNTINKEGQTNLILAVGADRLSLVKLLAENGADPDVKDMMGMSAYTYSILFKKEKIAEVLKPYHKEM